MKSNIIHFFETLSLHRSRLNVSLYSYNIRRVVRTHAIRSLTVGIPESCVRIYRA